MSRFKRESLPVKDVETRLRGIVKSDYIWPKEPAGWWLEFIAYPDGAILMDLLHPVSCKFWSEDNEILEQPMLSDGSPLRANHLKKAGIPFMGTMSTATVEATQKECHLKQV